MQNLLVHLLNPEVNKISKLFFRSELSPLDFNLALWDAVERGIIKIKGDKIKIICDDLFLEPFAVITDLQRAIYRTIEHYDKNNRYVPEVEFFSWAINAFQDQVYSRSAIVGALNWLEDAGLVHSVEATNPIDDGKENANKFKFYYITERSDGVSKLFELANAARKKVSA